MTNKEVEISKEERKMLKQIFFRSFTVFAPFNYAKQGGSGFCYALIPFINKFYKEKNEKISALTRHITWYNATQNVGTFIMGLAASMEKENSEKDYFNAESINTVKASLMGPFSGIGDTLFWGVLRVVAAGIAMTFGEQGNPLAPIIFLIIYNVPSIATRWYLTKLGYTVGAKYIESLYSSGLMGLLTKAASILGLIMIGGMTADSVTFETSLEFSLGGDQTLVLQDILDQIFVGIVPICFTLFCFYLLSKKKMNFALLIALVVVFGIFLSVIGIA
ncbi:PTS system mannose/fructose/sorbose family transporter subunit IID [Tetragenococcus koreensis]|uniref:PTS system mannose/fructose/sorbose family transporter subunit IID n=1 Tax=Tetragenococcus koreensis TaxID=290335 RepID=UPI001F477B1F|nr:PTS system mannose/fructose/sorbose family transporter subunit IID [Tetragenococcus koreensis]MDN6409238.1 PTS system mannose/fructose/sorbose family transporter subunit IID [Tetragenococcus halophilus]MDN6630131.1 PTS system mannose/fructose/sorbose family transporter subunit IID [Staphylococcus equorum]MCF1585606.1 PTS system mannose/fructose/sorbose family transporter subunit IID [Tetragenococcus koreensis]MCF1615198.1 PTS system mannose/fructose/sorbose family transporter subunit IID [Te